MAAFQKAQDELKGALSRLLVVQEQYPDLKANSAFHDLQVQLEGTENRLLRAREEYNDAVHEYNAELNKIGGPGGQQGDGQAVQAARLLRGLRWRTSSTRGLVLRSPCERRPSRHGLPLS